MEPSSLSLLLYKFYGASESDIAKAKSELGRRGWPIFVQLLVTALILPLIFVERFIADMGCDIWDEGPPGFVEITFSISFSVFIVTLIPGILFGLFTLFGKESPHLSTVLLLISVLVLTLLPLPRKKA